MPLGDGSALRLTTSEYFSPLGKTINEVGITPDVIVDEAEMSLSKKKSRIEKLFEDIQEGKLPDEEEDKDEEVVIKKPSWETDYQIRRALDLLKAIRVYNLQGMQAKK